MPRLSRSEIVPLLALVAVVSAVFGVILSVHYYNNHSGDWRIGVTAAAIAIGITVGGIAAAVFAWFVVGVILTVVTEIFDVIPALGAIAAGVYLLQYQSGSDSVTGTSWFEIIGHGMGIYFIAKGLFIGRTTYLQVDARNKLAQLVDLAGGSEPETRPLAERTKAHGSWRLATCRPILRRRSPVAHSWRKRPQTG